MKKAWISLEVLKMDSPSLHHHHHHLATSTPEQLQKSYRGKDLAPELDIQQYLESLPEDDDSGRPYPYHCPKCGRQYKTHLSLEVHMGTFNHDNPPEDYDPSNPEWKPKKREDRLKELEKKSATDSAPGSPQVVPSSTETPSRNMSSSSSSATAAASTPKTTGRTPHRTPGSRKRTFGSNRKRRVSFNFCAKPAPPPPLFLIGHFYGGLFPFYHLLHL